MQSSALSHVKIEPMQPNIGAEIHGIRIAQATDAEVDAIRAAIRQYKVVFFRDQKLSRAEHVAFGKRFGKLITHPVSADPDYPEILVIKTDGDQKSGPDAPSASTWHADTTFYEKPPQASILIARQVPALGGDTMWCNTAAVYAGLDKNLRRRIRDLVAIHSGVAAFSNPLDTEEKRLAFLKHFPPRTHPLVTMHPDTGEKAVFVNTGATTRILGVSESESRAILTQIFAEIARPEYHVRFHWREGSVAFWDNRATQHYGVADYHGPRHIERVTLEGERPVKAGD